MVYAAFGVHLLYSDKKVKDCGSSRMTTGPEKLYPGFMPCNNALMSDVLVYNKV